MGGVYGGVCVVSVCVACVECLSESVCWMCLCECVCVCWVHEVCVWGVCVWGSVWCVCVGCVECVL